MAEQYFCTGPEAAKEVNRITEEGVARTLYTYFSTDNFTAGFEWVEVGCEVPFHSHEGAEELIFCTHGEGVAYVDGLEHAMKAGVMVRIPRNTEHKFVNTGAERLGFTFTLNPPRETQVFMAKTE